MLLSNLTTLVMATARITNPNVTDAEFNNWYNTVLLLDFMTNHNVSLGLRYKLVSARPQSRQYLALYKAHGDVPTNWTSNAKWDTPNAQDIGPDDVSIHLSSWKPIQTFEALREKRGRVPAGRPKIAMVVKIEAKEGGNEEVDEWYRKQVGRLGLLFRRQLTAANAFGYALRDPCIPARDTVHVG
jgi:hypothetical protein